MRRSHQKRAMGSYDAASTALLKKKSHLTLSSYVCSQPYPFASIPHRSFCFSHQRNFCPKRSFSLLRCFHRSFSLPNLAPPPTCYFDPGVTVAPPHGCFSRCWWSPMPVRCRAERAVTRCACGGEGATACRRKSRAVGAPRSPAHGWIRRPAGGGVATSA